MIYNYICNLRSHTYFQGSEGGVVNYGWPTCLSNTCLFACAGKLHDRTQLPTIYVMQHLLDWNKKGPHLSFRQMEHVRETCEREYCGKQQHLLSCICLNPTVTGGDGCGNQQSPSWNLSPPQCPPHFPLPCSYFFISLLLLPPCINKYNRWRAETKQLLISFLWVLEIATCRDICQGCYHVSRLGCSRDILYMLRCIIDSLGVESRNDD